MDVRCFLLSILAVANAGCSDWWPSPPAKAVTVDRRGGFTHCPVHDRTLLEDLQPVEWMNSTDPFWDVRQEKFPFASDDLFMPSPDNVAFAQVMYCPDCRKAKAEWIEKARRDGDPVTPTHD